MKRLLLSMFIILLLCPLAYAWNFNTIGSSNDLGDTDSRADGEVIAWDATNEYYEHVAQSSSSAEGLWIAGDVNHIGPLTASINVTIDGNLSTTGIADIGGDIFTVGTKGAAVNAAVPTGNVDFSVKANAAHATGDIDVWGGEGGNASLALYSDERDDTTDDQVLIVKADNGNFTIANKVTGFTMATSGATTLTAVTADTLDTGQGANELYDMDQNVLQASDTLWNSTQTTGNLTVGNNLSVAGNATMGSGSGTNTVSGDLVANNDVTVVGNLYGGIQPLSKSGSYTVVGSETFGVTVNCDGAATITLPAIAENMSVAVRTIGAVAISVDPNGSDYIILDGIALDDGDKATNTSTAGDLIVLQYFSADGWTADSNSWTDGG